MKQSLPAVLLLAGLLGGCSGQALVMLAQGEVRGEAHDGFVSYLGIPYASMNGSHERFKKAGLAPHWSGAREAPASRAACSAAAVEDCLRLDVHVPAPNTPRPDEWDFWPVLVWVQSGGGEYHPGMLVREDIIVVMVNIRKGAFGFLCFGNERIPGNAGAKDLVLALRWVKDNIAAFKGSSAKVVVAGQGFGAAIVEAVMMSPMDDDLIHGVILQSGSILSPWAFNYDAGARARFLASMFTDSQDENEMVKSLLNADAIELNDFTRKLDLPYFPFGMCVESMFHTGYDDRLLSDAPKELLISKKIVEVPTIMGYNTDEAYVFHSNLQEARAARKMLRDLSFLLPEELLFASEQEVDQVTKQIKDHYFKNNFSLQALLDYHRDVYFVQHVYSSALLHERANEQPVYLYQFSHGGARGVAEDPAAGKRGAAHGDELAYLFPERGTPLQGEDAVIQSKLVMLWTNFVKFLNPTPTADAGKWEPLRPDRPRVLDIGLDLHMADFPYSSAMAMWEDIYDKYFFRRQKSLEF
ncbi:hypothetical protein JYU34_018432 [Plutella xylostella]|uniref:Carboxylesterase type B domain-containing protein n=1 Tax=Plutella xylostella TaxID=51655 RepID=A0ABQ7PXK2_PLUXY|nr:hypothetical protein JYU34_018432 [Plutella xylostella]